MANYGIDNQHDKPKFMQKTRIDKTIFKNPAFYSACSPGFFIILSILHNITACFFASTTWCFSAEFDQLVLQGGEDFTGLFKNLPELQESAQGWGCIVSAEGFAYIDARLDESFNLSVKEDLNPLKKVELLDEYFSAENKEHRLQFYNAWFYLIIAELLSVFLGILFLLLALFTPLRRCKGPRCESRVLASIAGIQNVVILVGLIDYAWGYYHLNALNKLELSYIININVIFWGSVGDGFLGLLFSFIGSIMTMIKGRYDAQRLGEKEQKKAKPHFKDIKDQLKNIGVTKGVTYDKTRNDAINRERMGYNDNWKPRFVNQPIVHDVSGTDSIDLEHLQRDLRIKGLEKELKTIAKSEDLDQGNRNKGGRNRYQNEENLGKDFGGSGRRSRNYALFPKCEEWMTEEEAKKVDWSRYHRRAGPRGADGRIKIYYAKPPSYVCNEKPTYKKPERYERSISSTDSEESV